MPRQITSVTATATGSNTADLTFSYSGVYDGGSNHANCGGGSGQVYTAVYKRDVTGGGSFELVTTLAGGATGATSYAVTGLTAGITYEFRADSVQRREAYDSTNDICVPVETGAASATSNQATTLAARNGSVSATLGVATVAADADVLVRGSVTAALSLTGSASATHPVAGGVSRTLGALTISAGATHPVTGIVTGALSASFSASGQVLNALSLAQTLGTAQAALTGLVLVGVRLNFTLDDVGCDLQAEQPWQRVSPVLTAWSPAPEGSTTWTPAADGSTIWN